VSAAQLRRDPINVNFFTTEGTEFTEEKNRGFLNVARLCDQSIRSCRDVTSWKALLRSASPFGAVLKGKIVNHDADQEHPDTLFFLCELCALCGEKEFQVQSA
jgi:hypothetical protein